MKQLEVGDRVKILDGGTDDEAPSIAEAPVAQVSDRQNSQSSSDLHHP
jgi:hypothetical protein